MPNLKRKVDGKQYQALSSLNDGTYTVYGPDGYVGAIRRVDQGIPGSKHRDVLFCPPNTNGLCWRTLGYAIAKMVQSREVTHA